MSNHVPGRHPNERSRELADRWGAVQIARMPVLSPGGTVAWIDEAAGHDRAVDPPALRMRKGGVDETVHTGLVTALAWDGERLVYAVADGIDGCVMSRAGGVTIQLARHPGTIEQLECFDGAVYALVAPPGTDGAVGTGAIRSAPAAEGAADALRRSVYLVGERGWTRLPIPHTVWEFSFAPGGEVVCVGSDDPTESGWYSASLFVLRTDGEVDTLLSPEWQIACPRVSPDGRRVAVLEGWASDRGMLAGTPLLLPIDGGEPIPLPLEDVTAIAWRDAESLWLCRWDGTDGLVSAISTAGAEVGRFHGEDDVIHAAAFPSPGARSNPVAVVGDGAGRAIGALRRGATPARAARYGWRAIHWSSADGRVIEGMLALPVEATHPLPFPLILQVHGGPANLWTAQPDLQVSLLNEAGYAVLRANPRGSVGRGGEFARANLEDPAGAELGDLVAGIDTLVAEGVADPTRIAAMGGSYGGYLTSALAVFSDRLRCAVVLSGHPDLVSARYGANNSAFYDRLLGGSPGATTWDRYLSRSPLFHVTPTTAPMLVVHGGADRCTPIGQADELARALADAHVEHRVVVYPDEGHGIRSRAALGDYWDRVLEWYERYLKSG